MLIRPVILACLLISGAVHAQNMTSIALEGDVSMVAPAGAVQSCGLSFLGFALRTESGAKPEADLLSGSISLHDRGYGMVKAGLFLTSMKNGQALNTKTPTQIAWIRIEGGTVLTPKQDKVIASDMPGYFLYVTDLQEAADSIEKMMQGRSFWVGLTKAGTQSRIFSATVTVKPSAAKQYSDCLQEMVVTINQKNRN